MIDITGLWHSTKRLLSIFDRWFRDTFLQLLILSLHPWGAADVLSLIPEGSPVDV
ncbi:hypothetical protein [Streptomyces platensis]